MADETIAAADGPGAKTYHTITTDRRAVDTNAMAGMASPDPDAINGRPVVDASHARGISSGTRRIDLSQYSKGRSCSVVVKALDHPDASPHVARDLEEFAGVYAGQIVAVDVDGQLNGARSLVDLDPDLTGAVDRQRACVAPLRLGRRVVDPGRRRRIGRPDLENPVACGAADAERSLGMTFEGGSEPGRPARRTPVCGPRMARGPAVNMSRPVYAMKEGEEDDFRESTLFSLKHSCRIYSTR